VSARRERLEKLEQRKQKILAEMERLRAQEVREQRKRDTRRKIIVGAMVLKLVDDGEWPKDRLMERLDGYLTRSNDRELFELPPRAQANAGRARSAPGGGAGVAAADRSARKVASSGSSG